MASYAPEKHRNHLDLLHVHDRLTIRPREGDPTFEVRNGTFRDGNAAPGTTSPHIDWDDFRYFLAAARSGSVSVAAKTMRTAKATVSRRLQELEKLSGVRLFDRRFDGMHLTPAAKDVLPHVEQIEHAAYQVGRHLLGADKSLSGLVRVTATDGIGSNWLTPRLQEFSEKYPEIKVELITDNRSLDLSKREADIAIRYARPGDTRLIAQEMGIVWFELVCSRRYATSHGVARSFDEINEHHAIVDHEPYEMLPFWRDLINDHRRVSYRSNSSVAFVQAICAGIGIGMLPRFYRNLDLDLISLDIPINCSLPVWLVRHQDTRGNARIQAMWDYLRETFRRDRHAWFSAPPELLI